MSYDLKNGSIDGLNRLLLNRRETARAMGISVRLLDSLTKEQQLPFIRLNRRVLFELQDVRDWLEQRKQNLPLEDETNKVTRAIGGAVNVPTRGSFGVSENDSRT